MLQPHSMTMTCNLCLLLCVQLEWRQARQSHCVWSRFRGEGGDEETEGAPPPWVMRSNVCEKLNYNTSQSVVDHVGFIRDRSSPCDALRITQVDFNLQSSYAVENGKSRLKFHLLGNWGYKVHVHRYITCDYVLVCFKLKTRIMCKVNMYFCLVYHRMSFIITDLFLCNFPLMSNKLPEY